MAQRISRAKERIRSSGVPFAMPAANQRAARLSNVLRVLYLIFNEGYTSTFGDDLQRTDLSDEAIRLTRMLYRLVPEEAEVAGLLALMLLTDARRAARTDAHGELVPLPEQDRSRWDRKRIAEGLALLEGVVRQRSAGEYVLQASIAAIHDQALRPEDTDWAQIEALYAVLERVTANPVVTVNRAVAAAMAYGPAAGLALLDPIDDRLADYHRLHAVRAQLLEMADDPEGALSHYRMAVNRTTSLPEKRFLAARAARLRDAARRSGG